MLPAPVVSIKCILFFSDKAPTPCLPNAAASTSMDASVDEMPVLVDHAARSTIGKMSGSLLLSTAGKGVAGSGGFDYDLMIISHGATLHAVDMVGSAHCYSAGLLYVIYGGLYCTVVIWHI